MQDTVEQYRLQISNLKYLVLTHPGENVDEREQRLLSTLTQLQTENAAMHERCGISAVDRMHISSCLQM